MSRYKREIFDELVNEIRRSQTATDRFDQAVADALGLNRTDMRCLDVLEREGSVSAGRLAQATGLTSGAMTTALDRLERIGYVRRVRDASDRRRVLVELTPKAQGEAGRFYREHEVRSELAYQSYSAQQLELLLRFIREGREFNEEQAARLEQQNRDRGGGPRAMSSARGARQQT
jgi:DNA-binding MarR family transcriptional regulator